MAALAVLLPRSAAAQAVSGTISGNVADPQGQVIPGATLTVINEATNDSRVTVSDGNGSFQVTNLQPGSYTVKVEMPSFRTLERKNVVLSAGERLSVGTLAARHRQPRRDRRRRSARHAGEHRRDAAQRPHHRQADRADPGPRPRRHVDHAAAAGRALREHRRLARHELRHVGAERRRRPPRLEQRHRRRRRRQRGRRHQPDGAADQPRCDRRGARAAQLVPGGVRPRRRRPGADRQQERHVELPRQPLLLRPEREPQRHQLLHQPRERGQAALPLQHLRRQPGRTGAQSREEALLLLLDGSAAREPPGTAAELDDADRRGDDGRLLADPRRPGAAHQHQGSAARRRVQRRDRRTRLLPGQHHPRQPHQLERASAC